MSIIYITASYVITIFGHFEVISPRKPVTILNSNVTRQQKIYLRNKFTKKNKRFFYSGNYIY